MALTYDLENDIRYQQGEKKGEERKSITAIKKMLKANVPLTQADIADFFDVPLEFVKKIADSLKK